MPSLNLKSHLVDVHCHPTDTDVSASAMAELPITMCSMSSSTKDQTLVAQLARDWPDKVVPAFGYHPWFVHQFSIETSKPLNKEEHYASLFAGQNYMVTDLPDPILLSNILAELRRNLLEFPMAMVGEIGLDKSFRVIPRSNNPLTLPFTHQLAIFEAQFELAIELQRNVSVHAVRTPQATIDLLDKLKAKHGSAFKAISVDLHSCSLSVESWKSVEKRHPNVYLSFSTGINGRSEAYRALIKAADPSRILVESDWNSVGECASRTWDILCIVAEVKGWKVEEDMWDVDAPKDDWGVFRRLEANWLAFKGNR